MIFAEVTAQAQMTMTTQKKGKVEIGLGGSGFITIDWGDGSEIITDKLSEWNSNYHHVFADTIIRTITITGKNITDLHCDRNELTSLNVTKNRKLLFLCCSDNQLTVFFISKNKKLRELHFHTNQLTQLDISKNKKLERVDCFHNQLTNLDVKKNTKLERLWCSSNQLNANALNALFKTLHDSIIDKKLITITNNPGTADCDTSIAEKKGWEIPQDWRNQKRISYWY